MVPKVQQTHHSRHLAGPKRISITRISCLLSVLVHQTSKRRKRRSKRQSGEEKNQEKNMEFVDQNALYQKCLADFISVTEHHHMLNFICFVMKTFSIASFRWDYQSWFSRRSEISPMIWQEFVAGEFPLQCETLSVVPITNFNSFNRWNQFFEHFLQIREKVESDFAGSSAISYPIGIWSSLINVTTLGSGTKFGKYTCTSGSYW